MRLIDYTNLPTKGVERLKKVREVYRPEVLAERPNFISREEVIEKLKTALRPYQK